MRIEQTPFVGRDEPSLKTTAKEARVNEAVNEWQYIVLLAGCHGDDKRTGRN